MAIAHPRIGKDLFKTKAGIFGLGFHFAIKRFHDGRLQPGNDCFGVMFGQMANFKGKFAIIRGDIGRRSAADRGGQHGAVRHGEVGVKRAVFFEFAGFFRDQIDRACGIFDGIDMVWGQTNCGLRCQSH